MITISDIGKVLTQIDLERVELDKESQKLTEQVNTILQEASNAVKRIGLQQEGIIQRRIALEQTAIDALMKASIR